MRRWRKIIGGTGGAEIAEAALVLPIAFMILLAIYWFGRAFNIYGTINHAAREGMRVAVANTCATCGNAPPPTATITTTVSNALKSSNLDPNEVDAPTTTPTYTACPPFATPTCTTTGTPAMYVCTNVQLQNTVPAASGNPACGVTVDFQYPWQMALPFTSLNGQLMKLSAHVQMRVEQ